MKKGDVIRQKCVNTTFYLTGILAHKVNNSSYLSQTTIGSRIEFFCDAQSNSSLKYHWYRNLVDSFSEIPYIPQKIEGNILISFVMLFVYVYNM